MKFLKMLFFAILVYLCGPVLVTSAADQDDDLLNVAYLLKVVEKTDGDNHGLVPRRLLIQNIKEKLLISQLDELNKNLNLNHISICEEFTPDCINLTDNTPQYIFDSSKPRLIKVKFEDGVLISNSSQSRAEEIFLEKFNAKFQKGYFSFISNLYREDKNSDEIEL
tara:strand:+ start:795 stop:1292 length:498 start_codon:yes stop_codon:yes gene_type:complete